LIQLKLWSSIHWFFLKKLDQNNIIFIFYFIQNLGWSRSTLPTHNLSLILIQVLKPCFLYMVGFQLSHGEELGFGFGWTHMAKVKLEEVVAGWHWVRWLIPGFMVSSLYKRTLYIMYLFYFLLIIFGRERLCWL